LTTARDCEGGYAERGIDLRDAVVHFRTEVHLSWAPAAKIHNPERESIELAPIRKYLG